MLTAAEVIGNSSYGDVYRKRLVFAAFAGEPWGYMGSKRFLWELHSGENSTLGISLKQLEQVGPRTLNHQKLLYIKIMTYASCCAYLVN